MKAKRAGGMAKVPCKFEAMNLTPSTTGHWWLTSILLATWKAEIGRISM
jgi:hypothetical protein